MTVGEWKLPGWFLWDPWPVLDVSGRVAKFAAAELWVVLAAPSTDDPDLRHDRARLHLLYVAGGSAKDLGPVLPDGFSAGSREWSGCTVFDGTAGDLIVYYTAAGVRDEPTPTFDQRVFRATVPIHLGDEVPRLAEPTDQEELVQAATPYLWPGRSPDDRWLPAFRDPDWFRDPVTDREYLVIAASLGQDDGPWGSVALASSSGSSWHLEDPIVDMREVNRELERPHLRHFDGRYYLFACAHAHMFTELPRSPTGLYGFVASNVSGPFTPLNGSGLVVANPVDRPYASYGWLVLPDRRVASFLNYPDEPAQPNDQPRSNARFAGAIAPPFELWLDRDRAGVVT